MNMQTISNFNQRLIIGSLATIAVFLAIYLSNVPYFQLPFTLFIATVVGTALWEFYSITQRKGYRPLVYTGIICSALYLASVFYTALDPAFSLLPQMILYMTFVIVFATYFYKGDNPLANIGSTLFGMTYLTVPLACLLTINFAPTSQLHDGRLWLLYLLIITKTTDIGAYFVGKLLRGRKLAPYISPSKTIAGAIGGFVTALVVSASFYLIVNRFFPTSSFALTGIQSLILGALIGIVAQFSDLAESLLKRDGDVKDSNYLPGLGGMLDIVDSLIFTAPLVYFFLKFMEASS